MANQQHYRINSISEYHQLFGLPKPEHPLISIVDYAKLNRLSSENSTSIIFGYYTISLKRGQQYWQIQPKHHYFTNRNIAQLFWTVLPAAIHYQENNQSSNPRQAGSAACRLFYRWWSRNKRIAHCSIHCRHAECFARLFKRFAETADRTKHTAAHSRQADRKGKKKAVHHRTVRKRDRLRTGLWTSPIIQQAF